MSSLQQVIARILTAEDALVEPVEPDGMSIVAPPHLQSALGIPEWTCIGFGAELPQNATRVTLESDWLERLASLLDSRSRLSRLSIPESTLQQVSFRDPEKVAANEIILENGVYRIAGTVDASTEYLLIVFRYTAVSDEKREELLTLCINKSNAADGDRLSDILLSGPVQLGSAPPAESQLSQMWPLSQLVPVCEQALRTRARLQLAPFLTGMKRRMTRDIERLHTYHSDLRKETARRLAEKIRKGDPAEVIQRENMKLAAIEREFHAKVGDLQRKYDVSVKVEPVQALRITTPVTRLNLTFMRRKGTRSYHLDWNPVSRKLDRLPCEACRTPLGTRSLCDEKLHFLCRNCLSECWRCHKVFCHACHPSVCPSCKHPAP